MRNLNKLNVLFFSKGIVLLFALLLIFSPIAFTPQKADAQGIGALACTGLSSVFGFISADILTTVPVNDSAVRKLTGDLLNKECSLDAIAFVAAKYLKQEMTNNVLNFIESGFDGESAFISDPKAYFFGIAEKEARDFIYNNEDLRNIYGPYQQNIRATLETRFLDNFGASNFAEQARCRLDDLVTDSQAFRAGQVTQGGLAAWYEATQNPACSYQWSSYLAEQELEKRVNSEVREARVRADWSNGTKDILDQDGKITTPGSIIATQFNKVLGQTFDDLFAIDEGTELLEFLTGQLTSQIFSRSGLISN